jgi:glucose-6-phosphate isomerase
MDRHFETAPASRNAPVLATLMAFRHRLAGCQSWAVVPYAIRLRLFCGWLQQLSMESLGKRVTADGALLVTPAGPVVWGGEGPDGQHAFFQMLHQGTDAIPVDVVAFRSGGDGRHRQALLANAVAQAEALLRGRSADEARAELDEKQVPGEIADRIVPHMVMPGGRSSTFILGERLDAASLGAILSFYEHQTFALSVLLGVNAFDQFGVELGKKLAKSIENEWDGDSSGTHDASTLALLNRLKG